MSHTKTMTDRARKPATPGKATAKAAAAARRQTVLPEQAHLIEMLDETMARLDTGIARERSALDALLSRLARKAA